MPVDARRDVFQAIADPTRRQIIDLISKESMNLNAIAENFDISRPAISQQIKILTECGLVVIKQQGRERLCEARLGALTQVLGWVEQHSKFWEARLDKLGDLLVGMQPAKNAKTKKRKK